METTKQSEPFYYLQCDGMSLSDHDGSRSEIHLAPIKPELQGYDHFQPYTVSLIMCI